MQQKSETKKVPNLMALNTKLHHRILHTISLLLEEIRTLTTLVYKGKEIPYGKVAQNSYLIFCSLS